MTRSVALLLIIAMAHPAIAASPDDVIEWTKAKMPEEDILERIRSDPSPARVSAHDALRMKAAGVTDAVLKALIEAGEAPMPEPDTPPPAETDPPSPTPEQAITSVDGIIDAHLAGVPPTEIARLVRRSNIRVRSDDRARMRAVGVPEFVIRAASTPPPKPPPPPTRRPARDTTDWSRDKFGDPGTISLELAGGFSSVSAGDVTASAGRFSPGLHALVASVLSAGLELDVRFGSGGSAKAALFGVVGVGVAGDSTLFRAAARLGGGGDGAAYGFELVMLGRGGRLLAGAGISASWSGDPVTSTVALDVRLGTWF